MCTVTVAATVKGVHCCCKEMISNAQIAPLVVKNRKAISNISDCQGKVKFLFFHSKHDDLHYSEGKKSNDGEQAVIFTQK